MDIIYDDDTDVVMDQLSNQFSRPCLNISFTFCLILLILMIVMVLFFYYTIPENFEYYTEIKFEILNPTGFMSDCLTLKAFLQLVSLKAMKNITPQFDVQIIGIRDQIGFNTVDNTPILAPIGHLLTIMYLPLTSTMYIYDSCVWQYSDTDKHKIENWLTACNLYQHVRFQWCRPLSQQLDNNSCGVYAIGYYSLLMRGFDPECVELESILHLRQNIWKMIRPFLKPVFYDVTRRNFAW